MFGQVSRPLARLGFSFNGAPHKALFFLFSVALTPSTFLNLFMSYSVLYPASQDENLENRPEGAFIQSARPLARLGLGGVNVFPKVFSLLFPTVPTPFTFSNSFPSYPTFC